ncbi:HEAT repeat domain-containing protein [candidate division KSB1 bacterium]
MNLPQFLLEYTKEEFFLLLVILLLLIAVFLLFIYAIYLKIYFQYRERYKRRKFAVWEETVLNQLYSGDFAHLFSMDPEKREIVFNLKYKDFQIFGEFIEDYLVDLRGEEYDNIILFLQSIGFGKLLMKAVNRKDKWSRAYAAHFLGLMKYKEAESRLLELVKDPSPIVYLNAFEALHRIESEKDLARIIKNILSSERIGTTKIIEIILNYGTSINPILIGLLEDKDLSDNNRRLLIDILAQKNVFESAEIILEIAKTTENTELMIGSIKALGILEDPDSADFLISSLKSGNRIIRSQSAKALGNIGDERAVPALTEILNTDKDYSVILFTVKALYNIKETGRSVLDSVEKNPPNNLVFQAVQYVLHEENV